MLPERFSLLPGLVQEPYGPAWRLLPAIGVASLPPHLKVTFGHPSCIIGCAEQPPPDRPRRRQMKGPDSCRLPFNTDEVFSTKETGMQANRSLRIHHGTTS
jgi:hypothetical protein